MYLQRIAIIVLFFLLIPLLVDGTPDYFKKITVTDGLSSNFVRTIHKDHTGYMWFGTLDGLERYDGVELRSFKDKFPENFNRVNSVTDIPGHSLWVGTEKGLLYWDYVSPRFQILYLPSTNDPVEVNSLLRLAGDTILLAGTSSGIFVININHLEVHHIKIQSPLGTNACIRDMVIDNTGIVWFVTEPFIGKVNIHNNEIKIFDSSTPGIPESSFSCITLIDDDIVLGTFTQGMFKFDVQIEQFRQMEHIESKYILSVEYSDDGNLYIGTDGNGLIVYNTINQNTKSFVKDINDPGTINDNAVYSLYIDEKSRIWAGTYSGGLNYLQARDKLFFATFYDSETQIEKKNIRSLYIDDEGNKIIGTDGSGVIFINQNKPNKIFSSEDSPLLRSNSIIAIQPLNNKILLGTFRGGISVFNTLTNKYEHFRNEPIFLNGSIYGFHYDGDKYLWIGGFNGVSKINLSNGHLKRFMTYNSNILDQLIISIFFDSSGRLWTGSVNSGTAVYSIAEDSLISVPHKLDLSNIKAVSFFEDKKNNIWISSEGSGWIRIDNNLEQKQVFTTDNGLPSNLVSASTEAPEGFYWISTLKGICHFNSHTGMFTRYSLADGLPGLVFNRGAVFNKYYKSGKIWFGSTKGLVSFYPDSLLNHHSSGRVIITDLFLSGQIVHPSTDGILKRPVDQLRGIDIGSGRKNVKFRFVALTYSSNTHNEFAYRLVNHSNEWNITKENTVTFSDLKPGIYYFEIYLHTGDRADRMDITSLQITIQPRFYTKPVFIVSILILSVALITLVVLYLKQIIAKIRMIKRGKRFKNNPNRYESSHLSEAQKNEIETELDKYLQKEKPYLNPDLKLSDLANHLGYPQHYLSQVINQNINRSFYEYINTYRINAVKECMKDLSYERYTLLAIGQECGFNSKTSFYRAFKKITGKSPQEYLESFKAEKQLPLSYKGDNKLSTIAGTTDHP